VAGRRYARRARHGSSDEGDDDFGAQAVARSYHAAFYAAEAALASIGVTRAK
jgi:uncharacterized protein (UPF0332 family)